MHSLADSDPSTWFHCLLPRQIKMEPVVGVEPTTDGLQNRCSTTELNWPHFQSGIYFGRLKANGKLIRSLCYSNALFFVARLS
jgi:hypothetical protein